MEASSNHRWAHIAKKYGDYRQTTKKSIFDSIDSTDYRVAIADSSEAARYLTQTGHHRVDAPRSELTREALEEIVRANAVPRPATMLNERRTLPRPRPRKFPPRKVDSSIAYRRPISRSPNPRKRPPPMPEPTIDPIPAELIAAAAHEVLLAPEEEDEFPPIDAARGLDLDLSAEEEDDLPPILAAPKLESDLGAEGERDSLLTVAPSKLAADLGAEGEHDAPPTAAAPKLEPDSVIEDGRDMLPIAAAPKLEPDSAIEDEDANAAKAAAEVQEASEPVLSVEAEEVGFGSEIAVLAYQVSAQKVPGGESYFEGLRRRGFSWVLLTDRADPIRGAGITVRTSPAPYSEDARFVSCLRSGDTAAFGAALESLTVDEMAKLVHFSSNELGFGAVVALLLLPGLRVLRDEDAGIADRLLPILTLESVSKGDFSIPRVTRSFGHIVAWKWAGSDRRVLVCLNWAASHAVAHVHCPDVPGGEEEIRVVELLTNEVYTRNAEEMRAQGLHVIVREWAIQIFEY